MLMNDKKIKKLIEDLDETLVFKEAEFNKKIDDLRSIVRDHADNLGKFSMIMTALFEFLEIEKTFQYIDDPEFKRDIPQKRVCVIYKKPGSEK